MEAHHAEALKLFLSTQKDRIHHFWKRRPLSIELYTAKVFEQKLDYIHNNPVKAGICEFPEEYAFSSARFYLDGTDEWKMLTHLQWISHAQDLLGIGRWEVGRRGRTTAAGVAEETGAYQPRQKTAG